MSTKVHPSSARWVHFVTSFSSYATLSRWFTVLSASMLGAVREPIDRRHVVERSGGDDLDRFAETPPNEIRVVDVQVHQGPAAALGAAVEFRRPIRG